MSNSTRKVSVRELQHNLSSFLELVKSKPLTVTRYGKEEVVLVNPRQYKITRKKTKKGLKKDIMSSAFIGMNREKKSWKGKTSSQIAGELRKRAWYGQ